MKFNITISNYLTFNSNWKSNFYKKMIDDSFLLNGYSLIKFSGYLDPGSLSALMALIIGGIAGAGMTLKLYWYKIKLKISRK